MKAGPQTSQRLLGNVTQGKPGEAREFGMVQVQPGLGDGQVDEKPVILFKQTDGLGKSYRDVQALASP